MTSDSQSDLQDKYRPRLNPRPTHRPPVSEGEQVVFGRPAGLTGSFESSAARNGGSGRPQPRPVPPDPVLIEAFSRPPGSTETLQRDPYAGPLRPPEPEPDPDPWRDTASVASLGEPGLDEPPRPQPQPDPDKLGVRDVLFGGRVSLRALAVLGVAALLLGLVGGAIGRVTGTTVQQLTNDRVTLPLDDTPIDDPGAVAGVVDAVSASVVTVELRGAGTGSGSVIDAGGGYILTNNHVVQAAANDPEVPMEVIFWDGTRSPAQLVGRDEATDIAVVRVSVNGLQEITRGDSEQLVAGQEVVAIGSPLGLRRTVTSGVVSATHRPVQAPADGPNPPATFDSVQTDAAINPGNSGGPLLDLQGRQIGINTLGLAPSGVGSIGLNFAIASNVAFPIAESIIRGEPVVHADIGINGRTDDTPTAQGVRVENVQDGSAADDAGIREGDVITRVGDTDVPELADLIVAIRKVGVGNSVEVTVVRDGRQTPITVVPRALN